MNDYSKTIQIKRLAVQFLRERLRGFVATQLKIIMTIIWKSKQRNGPNNESNKIYNYLSSLTDVAAPGNFYWCPSSCWRCSKAGCILMIAVRLSDTRVAMRMSYTAVSIKYVKNVWGRLFPTGFVAKNPTTSPLFFNNDSRLLSVSLKSLASDHPWMTVSGLDLLFNHPAYSHTKT